MKFAITVGNQWLFYNCSLYSLHVVRNKSIATAKVLHKVYIDFNVNVCRIFYASFMFGSILFRSAVRDINNFTDDYFSKQGHENLQLATSVN